MKKLVYAIVLSLVAMMAAIAVPTAAYADGGNVHMVKDTSSASGNLYVRIKSSGKLDTTTWRIKFSNGLDAPYMVGGDNFYQWTGSATARFSYKIYQASKPANVLGTMSYYAGNPYDKVNVATAVYQKQGSHYVNGRHWRTTCEPYSQTKRCRTDIWATYTKKLTNNTYTMVTGWVFNNLTYLPLMTRSQWGTNKLARPGLWESSGQTWRTECDTARTGKNACRSYIYKEVWSFNPNPGVGNPSWTAKKQWVFNNIVLFKV